MLKKERKSLWRIFRGWSFIFYQAHHPCLSCLVIHSVFLMTAFSMGWREWKTGDLCSSCDLAVQDSMSRSHCHWAGFQNNSDQGFTLSRFCLLKKNLRHQFEPLCYQLSTVYFVIPPPLRLHIDVQYQCL